MGSPVQLIPKCVHGGGSVGDGGGAGADGGRGVGVGGVGGGGVCRICLTTASIGSSRRSGRACWCASAPPLRDGGGGGIGGGGGDGVGGGGGGGGSGGADCFSCGGRLWWL